MCVQCIYDIDYNVKSFALEYKLCFKKNLQGKCLWNLQDYVDSESLSVK